jgi:UDP-N-acetylglucosamine--N-acetylmuramyl-(pentapeptide) pyrophosphoryl-undecaprenol N-acetylglucosamine transferase
MKTDNKLKILLVGGGSGGHLTPLFAVRDALLKLAPTARLELWTDKKMAAAAKKRLDESGPSASATRVRKVTSGKYRRYVAMSTPFRDRIRNFFDIFRIIFGVIQSFGRLIVSRPDVIFLKGGFVSVPVGIAAGWLKIPYIIHESDSDLGLANRILAKRAKVIALGLPPANDRLKAKAVYTGIPIDQAWLQARRIQKTGTPSSAKPGRPSVVVLGGGLGAHSLNLETVKMAKYFGDRVQITAFIGQAESDKLASTLEDLGVSIYRFVSKAADLAQIVVNADVIVARAGATTIAELAAAKKAVILVAKATLPGAHQEKNAQILGAQGAAIDYDGSTLADDKLPLSVESLLNDPAKQKAMGEKLHSLGRYDAANRLADILLEVGKTK